MIAYTYYTIYYTINIKFAFCKLYGLGCPNYTYWCAVDVLYIRKSACLEFILKWFFKY